MTLVGLISDTHGLMRPQALDALRDCSHIVHAGDIGDAAVIEALRAIAPVTAVRGNNDTTAWARNLPTHATLNIDGVTLHVVHDIADVASDGAAGAAQVVVSGHSHKPSVAMRGDTLYVNPGSAGPRRFRLPISLALLEVRGGTATARIVDLAPPVAH